MSKKLLDEDSGVILMPLPLRSRTISWSKGGGSEKLGSFNPPPLLLAGS
jgi:hypothetical protein